MNSVHDAVTRQWGELVELVVIQDAVTHQVDRQTVSLSFDKAIHLYIIHRVNGGMWRFGPYVECRDDAPVGSIIRP